MDNIIKIVIIGAGPAGISAAIQLKRSDIMPLILEKKRVGGLLREANLVENYPGFPGGILGKKLANLFDQQLKKEGIEVHIEKVINLDFENGLFLITTEKRSFSASIVIIATGTQPRSLDIELPPATRNRVFQGINPLTRMRNKKIAIIGAGDAAFDYALNLSQKNGVVILNRREKTRCLPLLWRRAMKSENISYFKNVSLQEVKPHKDGLMLGWYDKEMECEYKMPVSYLLLAIGREPCLDFLNDNIKNNLKKLQEMEILHLIGDVKRGNYRQTAISVGDGIKCAMKVYKKLKEETR